MAGIIAGSVKLLDRYNYESSDKVMPVDLAQLALHLQTTHNADDDIINGVGGYLQAATEDVEERANVAFINQKRCLFLDADTIANLPGKSIALTFGPVTSVLDVFYLASDDSVLTLDSSCYSFRGDDTIYFKKTGTWPTFQEGDGAVYINYECGHGTSPEDVPARWQNIIMQVAFRKYEYRMVTANLVNQGDEAYERMLDRLIVAAGGSRRG